MSEIIEKGKGRKPALGVARKGKGKGVNLKKNEGGETFNDENHILIERERRKKMQAMFTSLNDLLPHFPLKTDKATILEEAYNYIRTLESTLKRLEKQKRERLQPCLPASLTQARWVNMNISVISRLGTSFSAPTTPAPNNHPVVINTCRPSSNVVLNTFGNNAQFVVFSIKKPGLVTAICCVLAKHHLEVVTASIESLVDRCVYMFFARVAKEAYDRFLEFMNSDDIFKQAALEMKSVISS